MFACYAHGWSHLEKPCPLCCPVETYTSSSADIRIPTPIKPETPMWSVPGDYYQGLDVEDLKKLRKADALYIGQLCEDIDALQTKSIKYLGIIKALVNSPDVETYNRAKELLAGEKI